MNCRQTLQESFWIPWNDETRTALEAVWQSLGGGPELFGVRVRRNPGDDVSASAIFALRGRSSKAVSPKSPLPFAWTHVFGFPLPSMRGEIVARRIGPFVGITVRAQYAHADDVAAKLFQEALGNSLAQRTFDRLLGAVRQLVSQQRSGAAPRAA